MTWLWAALVDVVPGRALAAVALSPADSEARADDGVSLAFWLRDDTARPADALRVDGRIVAAPGGTDGAGAPLWLSWCRMEPGQSLPFDDGAVSGALRRRLAMRWPMAVSTMLVDWSRIAGAVTVAADSAMAAADPFARLFPRRLFRVAPGVVGAIPAPTGPCITRYGSGNPWPWDRYHGQV